MLYPYPVPDESEDESESSFVEGPKPTDEEKEKIAGEVGEALEENFQVCKEAKKAAAAVFKKQKKIDGKKIKGDATDGNCISNKADKENGDPNLKSDFYPLILAAHIPFKSDPISKDFQVYCRLGIIWFYLLLLGTIDILSQYFFAPTHFVDILKFIFSEKATKFCENSTIDLTGGAI